MVSVTPEAVYMFLKVFAGFSLLTRKILFKRGKKKTTSIETHNLEVDICFDL